MNDLKQFHLALVEAIKKYGFNQSVLTIHLVKAIYADEKLTNSRLAFLCGINEKTLYRNADDIRKIAEILPVCPTQLSYPNGQPLPNCPTQMGGAIGGVAEEERKSLPHTPSTKKEEHSSLRSECVCNNACTHTHEESSPSLKETLQAIRAHFDEYGNPIADQNIPADTIVSDEPSALKYEAEFEYFFAEYPKRRGLDSAIAKMQLKGFWRRLEQSGWDGKNIVLGLNNALVSYRWAEHNGQFIPRAINFLRDEEFRQFLPSHLRKPNSATQQSTAKSVPQEAIFNEILRIYPRRKGVSNSASMDMLRAEWTRLVSEVGYDGNDILRALKEAVHSKKWTDNNCQYIPTLMSFLQDELMLEFLPTGFKPKSRCETVNTAEKATAKPSWEPIVWDGMEF